MDVTMHAAAPIMAIHSLFLKDFLVTSLQMQIFQFITGHDITPNVAKYSAFFSRKPKANVTKQKAILMQQIFRILRFFCKELPSGSSSSSFIQQGKDAFISPMSFLFSKGMFSKKSLTFTSFFISLSEVIKCMRN